MTSDMFLFAFRELQTLQFKDFDNVAAYAKELNRIVQNLHKYECELPLMFINTHFVQGLAATYPDFVSSAIQGNIVMAEPGQTIASLDDVVYNIILQQNASRSKEFGRKIYWPGHGGQDFPAILNCDWGRKILHMQKGSQR